MKFKVNNNEVHASTGGRPFDKKKPLIIFVHGSGLTHMTWVLQTRYFAFHGYNALAVDLPGHGLSGVESLKSIEEMADWINLVIDAVGHKEASLVGHSQGCLVTVECTARYPDKIKTLSLMGGAGAIPMNPQLLSLAETYYESASEGIYYIPVRSRIAIAIALKLYRQIGVKLIQHGTQWWKGRTIVSNKKKILLSIISLNCIFPKKVSLHEKKLHKDFQGLSGANEF